MTKTYKVGIDYSARGNLGTQLASYGKSLAQLHKLSEKFRHSLGILDKQSFQGFSKMAAEIGKIGGGLRAIGGLRVSEAKTLREQVRLDGLRAKNAEQLLTLAARTRAANARALKAEDAAVAVMDKNEKARLREKAKLERQGAREKMAAERQAAREAAATAAKEAQGQRQIAAIRASLRRAEHADNARALRELQAHHREQKQIWDLARKAAAERAKPAHRPAGHRGGRDAERAGHYLPSAGNLIYPGMVVGHAMGGTVEAAEELNRAETAFKQMGLSSSENRRAFQAANSLSLRLKGVSKAQALETITDLHSVTKDLDEALHLLEPVSQFVVASRNKMTHGQIQNALKAAELFSKGKNGEEFAHSFMGNLQIFNKAQGATSFRVTGSDFLPMARRAGMARMNLNEDAMYKMTALMLEQGGPQTGTALMSAFQNLLLGRTTKVAYENLKAERLVTGGKEHGSGKTAEWRGFRLKDSELMATDPVTWFQKYMGPLVRKYGQVEGTRRIGQMLTNRTGLNLASTSILQEPNINREVSLGKGAMSIEEAYANTLQSYAGGLDAMNASLIDFKARVGTQVLPDLAAGIRSLGDALGAVNRFFDKNPGAARALGVGGMTAAAGLVTVGGIGAARAMWALPGAMSAMAGGGAAVAGGSAAGGAMSGALGTTIGTYMSTMLANSPIARSVGAGFGKIAASSAGQTMAAFLPKAMAGLGTAALWGSVAVIGFGIGVWIGNGIQKWMEESGWADNFQNWVAKLLRMATGGMTVAEGHDAEVKRLQAENFKSFVNDPTGKRRAGSAPRRGSGRPDKPEPKYSVEPRAAGNTRFAAGGLVPGNGLGDSVAAMLTPGELVLSREVTRYLLQSYGGAGKATGTGGAGDMHFHGDIHLSGVQNMSAFDSALRQRAHQARLSLPRSVR